MQNSMDTRRMAVDDLIAMYHGELRLSKGWIRLATVIGVALDVSGPVLEKSNCSLDVDIPLATLWLDADPLRMGQALVNLLLNAVRSGSQVTRVSLRAVRRGNVLELLVEDDRMVPDSQPGDVANLPEKAAPGNHTGSRGPHLGLQIARGIVEMHGGRMREPRARAGRGRCLVIELPLC